MSPDPANILNDSLMAIVHRMKRDPEEYELFSSLGSYDNGPDSAALVMSLLAQQYHKAFLKALQKSIFSSNSSDLMQFLPVSFMMKIFDSSELRSALCKAAEVYEAPADYSRAVHVVQLHAINFVQESSLKSLF
jgi:hypothetical protein